mgnify:CR=1 FL=1
MTIQLFPEQLAQTSFRDRMRARAAVLMSNRLAKSKPERIERVIGRWAAKYPVTDIESARKDRAAVCFVSGRARSQEGCLLRSISVARAAKLRRRSITWCSGFAVEPFRGHAWVEVGGTPVTEFAELREYTKSIEIRANGDTAVSADESADADSNRDETIDVPATAPAGPRDLFRLAKGRGRLLVGVGLLAIVSSGLTLAIPSFISRLFSSGTFKFPGMGMIGAFLGLILASGVATVFQHYYLQKVGESIVNDARRKLSRHLLRLQIKEYDERKTGDLISRVASDTSRLRTGFLQVFLAGTTGIPLILGAGVIMLVIDPVLLGTALMLIALMGLLIAVVSRVIQGTSLAAQHELGELTSRVERDMTAIRTIRAANATASESASLDEQVETTWQACLKVAKVQSVVMPIATAGLQVSAIVVILTGAYRMSTGALSMAGLIQFASLLFILMSPLSQMMAAVSELHSSLASLERVNEIFDLPQEDEVDVVNLLPQATLNLSAPALRRRRSRAPAIEFEDVYFTYGAREFGTGLEDDPDSLVLHGLNLTVPEGRRVAIVGPSGAGKSTVLQLVERFYDVDGGAIRVFGKDIRDYSREDLRHCLGYVEQDSPVLSGTLRQNLTLGTPDADDSSCLQALAMVKLDYLASRSPKGLDAVVGESGAGLSGGERQRLAIARSLLSGRKILLFDEATANLDSHNERQIGDVLTNLRGNHTVLVVAHRLSTIMDADLIHVLEHGRLVASGQHHQLVEEVPLYRDLAKEQRLV